MTRDKRDEARELTAVGGEGLSDAQRAWLQANRDECEGCRQYAEAVTGVVRSLRSLPLAADSRLVRATQMRVRFHASRLRETRERLWLVGLACLAVGLSATLTVPLLWRLFAWMGESAGVLRLGWQGGVSLFLVRPAPPCSSGFLAPRPPFVRQPAQ